MESKAVWRREAGYEALMGEGERAPRISRRVSCGIISAAVVVSLGLFSSIRYTLQESPLQNAIQNKKEVNHVDTYCISNPNSPECVENWIQCPINGCRFKGQRVMRYEDEHNRYIYSLGQDGQSYATSLADYSSTYSTKGTCYVLGDDASWSRCAQEGETCATHSPQVIKYSVEDDGAAFYKVSSTQSSCSRDAFVPTLSKVWYLDIKLGSPEWVIPMHLAPRSFQWGPCDANEDPSTCSLPMNGTKIVKFTPKSSTTALYRVATGSVACDAQAFLDRRPNDMLTYAVSAVESIFSAMISKNRVAHNKVACAWWRAGEWVHCSEEGQECDLPSSDEKLVRIGGTYGYTHAVVSGIHKETGKSSFTCNYNFFQDIMGNVKEGDCSVLQANITEKVMQYIAPNEDQRKVSRAAYILVSAVASLTAETPLFHAPNPHQIPLNQTLHSQCEQQMLSKKTTKFECCTVPQNSSYSLLGNQTCIKKMAGCCAVQKMEDEELDDISVSGHSRKLLSIDDGLDIPEATPSKRRRRRLGWLCTSGPGVIFSDIRDILVRLGKFVQKLPNTRAVRVSVKLLKNAIRKLSGILFNYIPTAVLTIVYHWVSGWLQKIMQIQGPGVKAVVADVLANLIAVIPFSAIHTPVQAINRRCQLDKCTIKEAAALIWGKHKLKGFFHGFGPDALRQLCYNPIWSLTHSIMEYLLTPKGGGGHIQQSAIQAISAGVSGGVAAFIAHPAEHIYEQVVRQEPGETDMMKVGKALVEEEGWRSLWRGGRDSAKSQSMVSFLQTLVTSQFKAFQERTKGDDEMPMMDEDAGETPEDGTAEWPTVYQFDGWEIVNTTMSQPPTEPEGDSWKRDAMENPPEFEDTMENWNNMSEEEREAFIKKMAEADAARETGTSL